MRYKKSMLSVLCALGLLAAAAGAQAEGWCESGKAVKFAGLNWESGTLLTELMQFVLAKGYGCTTDSLPGNSITMEQALSTNDIQSSPRSGSAAATPGTRLPRPARWSASANPSSARWRAGTCRAT